MKRRRARRGRGPAAWALCALALSGLVGCQSPGHTRAVHASAPRGFFGLDSDQLLAGAPAQRTRAAGALAATGIGVVREVVPWLVFEPLPGRYEFDALDQSVAAAARHRLTVLPAVVGAPFWTWNAGASVKVGGAIKPPRDPRLMAPFLTTLVQRYGPGGRFWREHPGLPRVPIRAWQIWNEPNLPQYWDSRPDARAYVGLLRVAHTAIHAADPGAVVVSAGVPNSRFGVPFERWIRSFYAAGARGSFDAFGLHAYARTPDGVVAAVGQARALMTAAGDRSTPIWMTEFGWADRGPRSEFTVSPSAQAADVGTAISALAGRRRALGLERVVYYQWMDDLGAGRGSWGEHTGLRTNTGRPKPAYRTFVTTLHGLRGP